MLFIDLEIFKIKLEDEAHFLSVSTTTCFYKRHKLYHTAIKVINNQILSASISSERTMSHNICQDKLKKAEQSAFRGISHHKISVIYAVGKNNYMIINITELGGKYFEKYIPNELYFCDIKEIISDSKSCIIQQIANQ